MSIATPIQFPSNLLGASVDCYLYHCTLDASRENKMQYYTFYVEYLNS